MSTLIAIENLSEHLPERIWYLSSDGRDLYCRRPYSFFFSSGEAALSFAQDFGVEGVMPIGIDAKEIVSNDLVDAFRTMKVTRIFIDPSIDPESGDVFGTILRFSEPN